MKLLFAVDLTEPKSVTAAVEALAQKLDADLLVLHVYTPTPTSPVPLDPMSGFGDFSYVVFDPQVQENIEKAEKHGFQDFLVKRFTRPVRPELLKGDPAETILEEAENRDADFIVLGKRHHSRLERLLLGSVTRHIAEHAARPVLLMPIPKEGE